MGIWSNCHLLCIVVTIVENAVSPEWAPAQLLHCRAQASAEGCSLLAVVGWGASGWEALGLQEVADLQGLDWGLQMATPRSLSIHGQPRNTLSCLPQTEFEGHIQCRCGPAAMSIFPRRKDGSKVHPDGHTGGGTPELFSTTHYGLCSFLLSVCTSTSPSGPLILLRCQARPLNTFDNSKSLFSPPASESFHSQAGPTFSTRSGERWRKGSLEPLTEKESEARGWPEPRSGSKLPCARGQQDSPRVAGRGRRQRNAVLFS